MEVHTETKKVVRKKVIYNCFGYAISELLANCNFNEVCHLLIFGQLPSRAELKVFEQELVKGQVLPPKLIHLLELMPKEADAIAILRTIISYQALYPSDLTEQQIVIRLLSTLISSLVYWFRFAHNNIRIKVDTCAHSLAEHLLLLLHRKAYAKDVKLLEANFILHAEEESSAATFAARLLTSYESNLYASLLAALCAVSPNELGAKRNVLLMLELMQQNRNIFSEIETISGFGHKFYKKAHPGVEFLKQATNQFAKFPFAYNLESLMKAKGEYPNLDLYGALIYDHLHIPNVLFDAISMVVKLTGFTAHIMKQRVDDKAIKFVSQSLTESTNNFIKLDAR